MNVLVIGANGQTGRQVVELLLEDNDHTVWAMVREASQTQEMEKLGAEPIVADLTQDIAFAVEGMEAVIFAAGSGPNTGVDQTWAVDRDGAIKVIDACRENAVERFIMLSSVGTDAPDTMPEVLRPYLEAKAAADQYLQKSGLNYTIIRPGRLNNDMESETIIAQKSLHGKRGQISRKDVAVTIVKSLENEHTYRQTFEIIGGGQHSIDEALKML